MKRGQPLPPEIAERIVQLTRQGRSAPEIAAMERVCERTVQRVRKAAGIAQPRSLPTPQHILDQADAMLRDGASIQETARTLGIGYGTVQYHFPGRGWTREQCAEYRTMIRTYGEVLA